MKERESEVNDRENKEEKGKRLAVGWWHEGDDSGSEIWGGLEAAQSGGGGEEKEERKKQRKQKRGRMERDMSERNRGEKVVAGLDWWLVACQ